MMYARALHLSAFTLFILVLWGCAPEAVPQGPAAPKPSAAAGRPATSAAARAKLAASSFPLVGNLIIVDWYAGGPMPCSYGSGTYPSPNAKSVTISYGSPWLFSDFNGHFRLVALYLNAYVDLYGYSNINNGLKLPPDPAALNNVAALTAACSFQGGNNCVNGAYHGDADGVVADVFATGGSDTYVGFSEQSFYILSAEPSRAAPLYAAQVPYGTQLQPMVYLDAFTMSAARCPAGSTCDANATTFASYMNTLATRLMIAYSWDLTSIVGPPRHLLPAITSFYDQPLVQKDPLYTQYKQLVAASNAFPNTINAALQAQMYQAICAGLKARNPQYVC